MHTNSQRQAIKLISVKFKITDVTLLWCELKANNTTCVASCFGFCTYTLIVSQLMPYMASWCTYTCDLIIGCSPGSVLSLFIYFSDPLCRYLGSILNYSSLRGSRRASGYGIWLAMCIGWRQSGRQTWLDYNDAHLTTQINGHN